MNQQNSNYSQNQENEQNFYQQNRNIVDRSSVRKVNTAILTAILVLVVFILFIVVAGGLFLYWEIKNNDANGNTANSVAVQQEIPDSIKPGDESVNATPKSGADAEDRTTTSQAQIPPSTENNPPVPPQKISPDEQSDQNDERPQRIETNSTDSYIDKYVRPFCNKFVNGNLKYFDLRTSGNTKYWYDGYGLLKIEKPSGTDNYDMSRLYYFDSLHGELIFAFVFDKTEEHRFYFKDGNLIRYMDPLKKNNDNPTSETVLDMANYILWEAYQ